ncbi:MAG: hypothetical protein J0I20_00355 [Chloroflexi bacterium]|nr:hypothetical protein [Chloroflexota bacterium]OJW02665.1 MAG: hypothetical protein BGO39_33165 [Chloroflexi bacterium 54-19]
MLVQTEMFSAKQSYNAITFRLEGIPVIYYQFFGTQPVTIQPGDFIRSKILSMVCGFVAERVELHLGRNGKLPGYRVRLADGRIDFIPADVAELIG